MNVKNLFKIQRFPLKIIIKTNDKIQTIYFQSKLNNRILPYKVILPRKYFSSKKKYPVFYLLHGLFGNFENWTSLTNLTEYAESHKFLIICPEGKDSWYTDNPNLKNHFYKSYILQELISDVEKRFRILNKRSYRAVGGLSMGGYGAFKFAFHKPEMFCFAASMSGAFDIFSFLENKNKKWLDLNPSVTKAFKDQSAENLKKEDLFYLAENFPTENRKKLPYFYFDCGLQDSLLNINRKFSDMLRKYKIKHQYEEYSGEHDWNYWDKRIKEILKMVSDFFETSGYRNY